MANEIVVTHIETLEGFEQLSSTWNDLIEERKSRSIFLTWEWLYAWWKTHDHVGTLRLIIARRQNQVIGIAPLMLVKEWKYGVRLRILRSLGAPNADEGDFLVAKNDPEVIDIICGYLLKRRSEWDVIDLREYRRMQSSIDRIEDCLKEAGLSLRTNFVTHLNVSVTGTWETYLKTLPKHSMQNIERRIRQVMKEYEFHFVRYKGQEIHDEHVEDMFQINKTGAYVDKYESEVERAMHYELLNLVRERGWMELTFILLNGTPVAFEYGFNLDGRFEDWRASFDHNYSKQGLGKSLLYLLMKHIFEQGTYHEFDFLRGEYSHKSEWNPARRDFVNLLAVKAWNIPARLACFVLPVMWQWMKEKFPHLFSKK